MFKVPILLLSYNRYECTKKSLNAILNIKPLKLYISNDGPKLSKKDNHKVLKTRALFAKIKSKKNSVKMILNDTNLGCKYSNLKAINWFFKHEREGIIIEDDCIASKDFFYFAENMLTKYRKKKKIFCISGSNFQTNPIDKNSYYFSKYNHCWGWATWKDRWRHNDAKIKFWPKLKKNKNWKNLHSNEIERKYWDKIFDKVYNNKVDSWAYPWSLSVWKKKGLTITPNSNLVENIGFGEDSTHSKFRLKKLIYKNKSRLDKKLLHPKQIKINNSADNYVFKNHFKGRQHLWPYKFFYLTKIFIIGTFSFIKKLIN